MEDGQVVNLKDLIDDMTQMATAAGLQAQSIFFMDSDTAELIVDWVETGVMGDALGLLIRRVVRPCPLISIASEHDVHEANALTQTKSSKKSEQLVSAQVTLRLNEHLSQVRRAFDLFIASSEREATAKFRRDVQFDPLGSTKKRRSARRWALRLCRDQGKQATARAHV